MEAQASAQGSTKAAVSAPSPGTRRILAGSWMRERGATVPLAMAAMVVLTALAVAAWTASRNNYFQSDRDKYQAKAFNMAEAGLEAAVWTLKRNGEHMSFPTTLTYSYPDGTAVVRITPEGYNEYHFVSEGRSSAFQGAIRHVETSVFYLSLWRFIMGAGSLTAGGGGVNGTTSVKGPFYVRGNLNLGGNSQILEGPLFVRNGDLNLGGSSRVGDGTTTRVPCYIDGSHPPFTDPDFYATVNSNVPDISLPALRDSEMAAHYSLARVESADTRLGDHDTAPDGSAPDEDISGWPTSGGWGAVPWVGSLGYKIVDNNGAPGSLGAGSYPGLTISSAMASFGDPTDQDFAWEQATRRLTVRGTVFVDGPVTFTGDIEYFGNGSIVANGPITINDRLKGQSYPSQNVLGLVTPTTIIINTNDPASTEANPACNGAYFATQSIQFNGNQAYIRGSLLSGNLTFSHPNIHIVSDPQLPDFLPEAMPGGDQRLTFPTHWQEGD